MLIAFAILNGVLWVGQEFYHRGDVKQAQRIEAQLDQLDVQILTDEAWLDRNRSYSASSVDYRRIKLSEAVEASEVSDHRPNLLTIDENHTQNGHVGLGRCVVQA